MYVSAPSPDPEGLNSLDFQRYADWSPRVSQFEVTSETRRLDVETVGFKRRVLYAPLKRRDLRVGNFLYLKLGSIIAEGETVEVKDRSLKFAPTNVLLRAVADPLRWSPAIHVNQVGYVPSFPKKAMVGYYLGSLGEMEMPSGFRLEDVDSGKPVHEGRLKVRRDKGFTSPLYQQVFEADFSEFKKPGEYRLAVPGLGVSFPFFIDEGVAAAFARTYALGLYHQRCGIANTLPFTRFTHGPCHTAAADVPLIKTSQATAVTNPPSASRGEQSPWLYPYVKKGKIDVAGGHHDAGDYSKYTINSAALIHYLVFAADAFPGVADLDNLGLPESGDGRSDLLQEAKWEADYLAKIQDSDGGFYFGVFPRSRKYEDDVLPDRGDPQVVWPKNTAASAAAVAALAQAASSPRFRQQFPEAARIYLEKATLGWTFLRQALERFGAGAYQKITHYGDNFGHDDELAWAATELFLATGDPAYHKFLLARFHPNSSETRRWGWWRLFEGYGCAIRSYAFAVQTGRQPLEQMDHGFLAKCRAEILAGGADQLRYAQENAYGTSFPAADKRFRSAGWYFSVDRAFDMVVAHHLDSRSEFLDAILSNLNYEAGCNPVNVTYLTGLGWKRQREIVHQYAQNDHRVLPPSGIPLGNVQAGFGHLDLYRKQLGALSFPPDWDKDRPYPFYDRWGDSFNLPTEFVHVQQARGLATTAFLMTQTSSKTQAWRSASARILIEGLPGNPSHLGVRVEADGMNPKQARVVWEAEEMDPAFGLDRAVARGRSGPRWIEVEAVWPDGRRVFATTNLVQH